MTLSYKPTRMEMTALKKRLVTAKRGHKLMKDKRDEMVRRFIAYVRRNKELRERAERMIGEAMEAFVLARASMSAAEIEEALCYPASGAGVAVGVDHVLSIEVPKFSFVRSGDVGYPYGFMTTGAELDEAVRRFTEVMPILIELAEVEKTCNRLADEIEKTRRRVNALEYVMIPQLEEAIRRISMKLEENERGNLTRLMKTKDMLNAKEQSG